MAESTLALYRLVFATDMTSARSPTIALGYMLESALDGGSRFLGLVSRKSLTREELATVNLKTWPQLRDLDGYMEEVFRRAWDHVLQADAEDSRLGSEFVAREHPVYSALSFERMRVEQLGLHLAGAVDEVHSELYSKLHELAKQLKPVQPQPKAAVSPAPTRMRAEEDVLEFA